MEGFSAVAQRLREARPARYRGSPAKDAATPDRNPSSIPPTTLRSWKLRTGLISLDIALEDIYPDQMRGYGEMDPAAASDLSWTLQEIRRLVSQLLAFLSESQEAQANRLAHVQTEPALAALLKRMAQIIANHGLVEFLPALDAIIRKLESHRYEIAVFGRVSSGKSSLINRLNELDRKLSLNLEQGIHTLVFGSNLRARCGIVLALVVHSFGVVNLDLLQHIDVGSILIQFAVLLFSLSIHEASHAWVADRCGDYTARYLGRVTLNPIAHMDPFGTLLFPLLQFFTGLPLIGWAKPVPINSIHFRNPHRDQILVSLAGPGSNLVAAGTSFVLLCVLKLSSPSASDAIAEMIYNMQVPHQNSILVPLLGVLFFAFVINMALAIFNVIPIPPLDGHWVLHEMLPYNAAKAFARVSSYGIFLLYALMLLGVFRIIFLPIQMMLLFLLRL